MNFINTNHALTLIKFSIILMTTLLCTCSVNSEQQDTKDVAEDTHQTVKNHDVNTQTKDPVNISSNPAVANHHDIKTFYHYGMSGYGIINDTDGYVNLREKPNAKSKIIDRINGGTLVYCHNEGGRINDFCLSDTPIGQGYIHSSRIALPSFELKAVRGDDGSEVLSYQDIKVLIRYTEDKQYVSMCLFKDSQKICVPQDKLQDLKPVHNNWHTGYIDAQLHSIYIISQNNADDKTPDVIWTIIPNKEINRWVYDYPY